MISWFTDNSFFPVLTGGILAVVFFVFFVMSREKTMLYISMVIACLVGAVFVSEQLIVTDREKIETIVYDLAAQVRANNVAGVVAHMDTTRQDTIRAAKQEMPKYLFDDCRLTGISNFADVPEKPNTKIITFVVVYQVSLRSGQGKIPGQRRVELTFHQDPSGSWKVTDYQHSDPRSDVRL